MYGHLYSIIFSAKINTWLLLLLAQITDVNALRAFWEDLCTAKELENMAERCYAVKLLLEGKTYNQVMEVVEISSATLSRVSRCVQYGSGYKTLLAKN